MTNKLLLLSAVILLFFVAACSGDGGEESGDVLLKINNYSLTQQDFKKMFRFEIEADRNFDLSGSAEAAFLNELIRKQLLIQQAQELQLDREEEFRQTIQRYWESTLIRDLLRKKSEEFKQQTPVTADDVKKYYDDNIMEFDGQEFEVVKDSIKEQIERDRIGAKMDGWLEQLVKEAQITIADPELEKKLATEKELSSVY